MEKYPLFGANMSLALLIASCNTVQPVPMYDGSERTIEKVAVVKTGRSNDVSSAIIAVDGEWAKSPSPEAVSLLPGPHRLTLINGHYRNPAVDVAIGAAVFVGLAALSGGGGIGGGDIPGTGPVRTSCGVLKFVAKAGRTYEVTYQREADKIALVDRANDKIVATAALTEPQSSAYPCSMAHRQ